MSSGSVFDRRYYDRFYRDPRTRVIGPETTAQLARFVTAYLDVMELEVTSVLDIGCGLGWWRDALAELLDEHSYTGVEISSYLVDEYGWELGSVVDYTSEEPFDLVICQGVLQYLDNTSARSAMTNLATLTGGALYLEALTKSDWEENCDTDRTDGEVHLRAGSWYRRKLADEFHQCGGGVFVKRDADVALFELEHL